MTTTPNALTTARQHLTRVTGFDGYFANKEGGDVEAETTPVWDGGSLTPEQSAGPAVTGNVIVSRPYRAGRDKPILDRIGKQVGRWRTTVSIYDTDPDLGPIGVPDVYDNALLVRLTRPQRDASSSDPGTFELEFAVTGLA